MGSSGVNNLGDYTPDGTTKCDLSVDANLEDVARLDYYKKHSGVPLAGNHVRLRRGVVAGRLVVEDSETATIIGHLPTRFHYLRLCQEQGYGYEGEVTASRDSKVPVVEVHLDPV